VLKTFIIPTNRYYSNSCVLTGVSNKNAQCLSLSILTKRPVAAISYSGDKIVYQAIKSRARAVITHLVSNAAGSRALCDIISRDRVKGMSRPCIGLLSTTRDAAIARCRQQYSIIILGGATPAKRIYLLRRTNLIHFLSKSAIELAHRL